MPALLHPGTIELKISVLDFLEIGSPVIVMEDIRTLVLQDLVWGSFIVLFRLEVSSIPVSVSYDLNPVVVLIEQDFSVMDEELLQVIEETEQVFYLITVCRLVAEVMNVLRAEGISQDLQIIHLVFREVY